MEQLSRSGQEIQGIFANREAFQVVERRFRVKADPYMVILDIRNHDFDELAGLMKQRGLPFPVLRFKPMTISP